MPAEAPIRIRPTSKARMLNIPAQLLKFPAGPYAAADYAHSALEVAARVYFQGRVGVIDTAEYHLTRRGVRQFQVYHILNTYGVYLPRA